MFYCPYVNYFRQTQVHGHLRLLHASPNLSAVDVYANGSLIARNFRFKNFTEYIPVSPGNYRITVYPSGNSRDMILDTNISVGAGNIITAAIIGRSPRISIKVIMDPRLPVERNRLMLRFVNLSPDLSPTNLTFRGNDRTIFNNVKYPNATEYTVLSPGVYNFELRNSNDNKSILLVPNVRLTRNRFYTMYAVGLAKGGPPLQVLIALDGNSYIR